MTTGRINQVSIVNSTYDVWAENPLTRHKHLDKQRWG